MDRTHDSATRLFRKPASSVCEDGDNVIVMVEMPGVSKEGLEVKIEGNGLSIRGWPGKEEEEGTWLLRERRGAAFAKDFTLDETIDRNVVDASLVNGVLTLKLMVKEAAKPRLIEIA